MQPSRHDQPTLPDPAATTAMGLSYRCVCGEAFVVTDDAAAQTCPHCDREYEPAAFRGGGETLALSLGAHSQALELSQQTEAEDDPLVGQQLDHYQLVECLGRGGMGAVYRAVDQSLQRDVAVKVIHTGDGSSHSGGSSPRQVERLIQEARAQARVNHPNVVHIHYVGLSEENPFFAMELVGGRTLAERLDDPGGPGRLAFDEVLSIAVQVVAALDRAAAFDIVHGDVKPSNILEAGEGVVKLSDFGLAQRISRRDANMPHITGTPDYLSPEAGRGEQLDERSDMYSLGVTLFQLTFGRLPYQTDSSSILERINVHQHAAVEFPDPWPADVPERWRDVLERMMSKRREDRFASYEELAKVLHEMRPMQVTAAGRLPRAIAWVVDQMLVFAIQAIMLLVLVGATNWALSAIGLTSLSGFFVFLWSAATLGVPLGAAALQAAWATSPGKRLFQLRIADTHGHRPTPQRLAIRAVFQLSLLWLFSIANILFELDMMLINLLLHLGVWLLLLVDMGFALFHPEGRSVHDVLLGTRVVLDSNSDDHDA